MKRLIFNVIAIFIIYILPGLNHVACQFMDDFKDGDIQTDPMWLGNTEHFIINNQYKLQLDAPEGGNSVLYTQFNAPDSIEWGFYFKMDFSPSATNKLRVYLLSDNNDITKANAYFIEIGENGSQDNIKFYKSTNGVNSLLGTGSPGSFATEPASGYLRIKKDKSGTWTFDIKTDKEYFTRDFSVKDQQFNFSVSYFIIQCIYTSTRKDKFFFDDIYARIYESDNRPPVISGIIMKDTKTLEITFDEPVDENSVYDPQNYRITGSVALPVQIMYDILYPNRLTLIYNEKFEGGKIYTLFISGVEDINGNTCQEAKGIFYIIENPEKEDLIINEVLFNPFSGSNDFIEILNRSKKFINLKGLSVFNSSISKAVIIKEDLILRGGDYVCLTEDPSDIVVNYYVPDSILFIETSLPSLNDDKGNVSIIFKVSAQETITIDSFDYSENMHSGFIDNNEGISLERRSPFGKTTDRFNWTSCSTLAGGATPGYINSAYFESEVDENGLFLTDNVFSPDEDGYKDELILEYKMPEDGFLLNIAVFDSKGRFVHQLVNNETLGLNGQITWDGIAGDHKVPLGIYILYYRMIGEDGNSKKGKLPFVVARKLK
ncbi:MAG: Ig-like domain-containing protein [Deltaproteobacteria bacterium]